MNQPASPLLRLDTKAMGPLVPYEPPHTRERCCDNDNNLFHACEDDQAVDEHTSADDSTRSLEYDKPRQPHKGGGSQVS